MQQIASSFTSSARRLPCLWQNGGKHHNHNMNTRDNNLSSMNTVALLIKRQLERQDGGVDD